MLSAEALAGALGLKRTGRNSWRGACPACGGGRRFVVNEARDGTPLWWCFVCGSEATEELRRRGLLGAEKRQPLTEEQRKRIAARRERAAQFCLAVRRFAEHALELCSPVDPAREAWTLLVQEAAQAETTNPVQFENDFRSANPQLHAAIAFAARRQRRRAMALAKQVLDFAILLDEREEEERRRAQQEDKNVA